MKKSKSKVLTIITESLIEQKLVKCLKELGATGYTIEEVRGEGRRGIRRSDWDQAGSIRLQIVCDEQLADRISGYLAENYMESYAMFIFMFDAEIITK
jgi:nitrogen regulatory protein PII